MRSFDRDGRRWFVGRGEPDAGAVEATLTAIERSLDHGAPAGADERERALGHLALTLRAGAPAPTERFEAELARRTLSGFVGDRGVDPAAGGDPVPSSTGARAGRAPGAGRLRRLRRAGAPLSRPRLSAPALGAIAGAAGALALGVGLLAGGLGGGAADTALDAPAPAERSGGAGGEAAPRGTPESRSTDARDGAAPSTTTIAPDTPVGGEQLAPNTPERHVERSASLTLAAAPERIDAVAAGIVAVVVRHRGFVVSSSTFSSEERGAGGSFDVRVPSDRLRPAVTDLAQLATLRSQSETGSDITAPVETAADRLEAARAERRSLLRRLGVADTARAAAAIRERLRLVSGEVRGADAQLRALRERAGYARVALTLTDGSDGEPLTGDTTADALDDALATLVAAFNLLVRALGVLVPLGAVVALVWIAWRSVRRRRREAVLG